MRYFSLNPNLTLFSRGGKPLYKFRNGYLDVGDPLTNIGVGNSINADERIPVQDTLQSVYSTDLAGTTSNKLQMAGLGTYDKADRTKLRLFTECLPLVSVDDEEGGESALDLDVGDSITIISGELHVTNPPEGTKDTYGPGETFTWTTAHVINESSIWGTFQTGSENPVGNECLSFRCTYFKLVHLQYGDEVTRYFRWTNQGFDPRNAVDARDIEEGVGYIR